MKKFLFFSATLAFLFFASCTKNTTITAPVVTTTPITGGWVGTYFLTDATNLGIFYYGIDIFSDSTVILTGGGPNAGFTSAHGTWSLSADSVFTAIISNNDPTQGAWTQRHTANFSAHAGTLTNGKYVYISGGTETGQFSVKRVQ